MGSCVFTAKTAMPHRPSQYLEYCIWYVVHVPSQYAVPVPGTSNNCSLLTDCSTHFSHWRIASHIHVPPYMSASVWDTLRYHTHSLVRTFLDSHRFWEQRAFPRLCRRQLRSLVNCGAGSAYLSMYSTYCTSSTTQKIPTLNPKTDTFPGQQIGSLPHKLWAILGLTIAMTGKLRLLSNEEFTFRMTMTETFAR